MWSLGFACSFTHINSQKHNVPRAQRKTVFLMKRQEQPAHGAPRHGRKVSQSPRPGLGTTPPPPLPPSQPQSTTSIACHSRRSKVHSQPQNHNSKAKPEKSSSSLNLLVATKCGISSIKLPTNTELKRNYGSQLPNLKTHAKKKGLRLSRLERIYINMVKEKKNVGGGKFRSCPDIKCTGPIARSWPTFDPPPSSPKQAPTHSPS